MKQLNAFLLLAIIVLSFFIPAGAETNDRYLKAGTAEDVFFHEFVFLPV